jgi:hypothetical protein
MHRLSHVLAHQDRHAEMQVETAEAQLNREWVLAHGRAEGDCDVSIGRALAPCAALALETGTDSTGSCTAACTCGS